MKFFLLQEQKNVSVINYLLKNENWQLDNNVSMTVHVSICQYRHFVRPCICTATTLTSQGLDIGV